MRVDSLKQQKSIKGLYWTLSFFALLFCVSEISVAVGLETDGYNRVSRKRVGRVVYEYKYTLNLTNTGGSDAVGVTATVSSTSPHTVIVDSNIAVGNVAADSSVTSADTFSFRQDRRFPFDHDALKFTIHNVQSVAVPYVQNMTQQLAEKVLSQVGLVTGIVDPVANFSIPVGLVYRQSPRTGTQVIPGSAVDLRVSVAPPEGGVIVPSNWSGLWKISVTYADQATGAIVFKHTETNTICPGDVVGLTVLNTSILNCNVELNGDDLAVNCNGEITKGMCTIDLSGQFALIRELSGLVGNGLLTSNRNSFCLGGAISFGESLQINGMQLNTDTRSCDLPHSSLIQSFLRHPRARLIDKLEIIGVIQ